MDVSFWRPSSTIGALQRWITILVTVGYVILVINALVDAYSVEWLSFGKQSEMEGRRADSSQSVLPRRTQCRCENCGAFHGKYTSCSVAPKVVYAASSSSGSSKQIAGTKRKASQVPAKQAPPAIRVPKAPTTVVTFDEESQGELSDEDEHAVEHLDPALIDQNVAMECAFPVDRCTDTHQPVGNYAQRRYPRGPSAPTCSSDMIQPQECGWGRKNT